MPMAMMVSAMPGAMGAAMQDDRMQPGITEHHVEARARGWIVGENRIDIFTDAREQHATLSFIATAQPCQRNDQAKKLVPAHALAPHSQRAAPYGRYLLQGGRGDVKSLSDTEMA